jgi:nanoRNase/pAp phosphatase (c-di-AMP/oligoRNAs hydrolase)
LWLLSEVLGFFSWMRALVTCHHVADADALGSMVLARVLLSRANFAIITLLWPSSSERALQDVASGSALGMVAKVDPAEVFDLVVVVDTADKRRLPHIHPWLERGVALLVVDHHERSEWDVGGKHVSYAWGSCTSIVLALLCLGFSPLHDAVPTAEMLSAALAHRVGSLASPLFPPVSVETFVEFFFILA